MIRKQTRVRPLAPLCLLGCLLLGIPAALAEAEEGVAIQLAEGQTTAWSLEPDEYSFILVTGDEAARLDVRRFSPRFNEEVVTVEPARVINGALEVAQGERKEIVLQEGNASILMGRMDLQRNLPVSGPPNFLSTNATLAAGECRAYPFTMTGMRGKALIEGEGAVRFSILRSDLEPVHAQQGRLEYLADADKESTMVVQACAPLEAASPAQVGLRLIYPAPASASDARTDDRQVPGALPALALVAISACAVGLRALRRR